MQEKPREFAFVKQFKNERWLKVKDTKLPTRRSENNLKNYYIILFNKQ
jgi:hypothetical protein